MSDRLNDTLCEVFTQFSGFLNGPASSFAFAPTDAKAMKHLGGVMKEIVGQDLEVDTARYNEVVPGIANILEQVDELMGTDLKDRLEIMNADGEIERSEMLTAFSHIIEAMHKAGELNLRNLESFNPDTGTYQIGQDAVKFTQKLMKQTDTHDLPDEALNANMLGMFAQILLDKRPEIAENLRNSPMVQDPEGVAHDLGLQCDLAGMS